MIGFKKKIYIENFCGICNRLEIFVLAFAIHRAFGHEIILGWPELDVLQVEGTGRGTPGLLGRWGAVRLRKCDSDIFLNLDAYRKIILRGFSGPLEWMATVYEEATSKLSIHKALAEELASMFHRLGQRPVVGVHLRQGDYPLLSDDIYDLRQSILSAVPIWWHEWVMQAILRRQPDVCFLVCHNGEERTVSILKKNFDIMEVPILNPYRTKAGHRSKNHPVADLFALACCPVILATPMSSFSHYAGNVLGHESICLVPPPQMKKDSPAVCRVNVRKQLLEHWVLACLGQEMEIMHPNLSGMNFTETARIEWLRAS